MDVGDFLNKVYDQTIDFGSHVWVMGTIGASLGYAIASVEGLNKPLLTQAFAVYSVAF